MKNCMNSLQDSSNPPDPHELRGALEYVCSALEYIEVKCTSSDGHVRCPWCDQNNETSAQARHLYRVKMVGQSRTTETRKPFALHDPTDDEEECNLVCHVQIHVWQATAAALVQAMFNRVSACSQPHAFPLLSTLSRAWPCYDLIFHDAWSCCAESAGWSRLAAEYKILVQEATWNDDVKKKCLKNIFIAEGVPNQHGHTHHHGLGSFINVSIRISIPDDAGRGAVKNLTFRDENCELIGTDALLTVALCEICDLQPSRI